MGNKVKDVVTGFTGIAAAKIEYLNGCVQFGVKPPVSEASIMSEISYIDVQQLEYVAKGVSVDQLETGGDHPDAPRY